MNFAEKIKILRTESGCTQKEFAMILNCATISIQNYERNRKNPNGSLMQKLCKQFPQYALWLMTDIDDISKVINQSPIKAGDH
jgi:transcriptional regulator with XRE-family HTH domain